MSKAFTRESDKGNDEEMPEQEILPAGEKLYMTPGGAEALREELKQLLYGERPKIVEIVSWAAGNGDRSENGDYIYGKKRLREIDRRVRYIGKRLEHAEIVDPARQQGLAQVFFGATVTYARDDGREETVTLVGVDEANAARGKISWRSPVAQALMKRKVGDVAVLRTPAGHENLEILALRYGKGPE